MAFQLDIRSNISSGPLAKRPVVLTLIVCAFVWMGMVAASFVDMLTDHYFPYEGKVVAIKTHWTDHVTFESVVWDRLIIQTANGELIDKKIGRRHRLLSRISVGDHAVKRRGFQFRVRPRGKWTTFDFLNSNGKTAKLIQ